MSYIDEQDSDGWIGMFLIVIGVILAIAIVIGLIFAFPIFGRYQAIQEAQNQIQLNELRAKQTEQLVGVEQQKAQIKVEEAKGIAEAQKIINATLTDQYLQHEAIQAQKEMAGSPSHTQIYIPTGSNGIPIVKTINANE